MRPEIGREYSVLALGTCGQRLGESPCGVELDLKTGGNLRPRAFRTRHDPRRIVDILFARRRGKICCRNLVEDAGPLRRVVGEHGAFCLDVVRFLFAGTSVCGHDSCAQHRGCGTQCADLFHGKRNLRIRAVRVRTRPRGIAGRVACVAQVGFTGSLRCKIPNTLGGATQPQPRSSCLGIPHLTSSRIRLQRA